MDETDVTAKVGKHFKVFSGSASHSGGARISKGSGKGRHLTAVVWANAAGDRLPSFFIFQGGVR